VAAEPELEAEPALEAEPEPERDPNQYAVELLGMAQNMPQHDWDTAASGWLQSKYERTSIGKALTQGRMQSQLAPSVFERITDLLSRGLTAAHEAQDHHNTVVFMNMLNTFSLGGEEDGKGGSLMMSQHPTVLSNDLWRNGAFWESAMQQLISNERLKTAEMMGMKVWTELSDEERKENEMIDQNTCFGALSNIVQQMLTFSMPKARIRAFVLEQFKEQVIKDREQLDQLVQMLETKKVQRLRRKQTIRPKTISERQKALETDSPSFRQNMRDKEQTIEKMGQKIQTMVKLVENYANSHKGLTEMCAFIETELSEESQDVDFDFLKTLRMQEACFQTMLTKLQKDVVNPMQEYYAEEITVIKKKKKHFEQIDDQMDSAMIKYLSMKKDTAPEVLDQAEKQLTKKHDSFEIERFDTHCTIEEVEGSRSMFWQKNLAAVVDIHAGFHAEALASLRPDNDALLAVKSRIEHSDKERRILREERVERRAILEKSTLAFLNQQAKTVTEGWLEKQPFDLAAEKKSTFLTKVSTWQRRYFELKSDGMLFYYKSPGDRDSCSMPVDFNVVTEVTEVTAASWRSKKHTEDVAARQLQFMFAGRPCLLKAEAQEDRDMWMLSLKNWVSRSHVCQQEPESIIGTSAGEPSLHSLPHDQDVSQGPVGVAVAATRADSEGHIGAAAPDARSQTNVQPSAIADETDEDPESKLAREFGTALHHLGSDLGHDSKKVREAYHTLLSCMKSVIENPTDQGAKTLQCSNKVCDFAEPSANCAILASGPNTSMPAFPV
jgi:hypothetical protein